MGLKDAAKALMEQAGVPVVPGYHGSDQGDEHLRAAASDIGYPVLIKAVAGGGAGCAASMIPATLIRRSPLRGPRRNPLWQCGCFDRKIHLSPRHIEVQVFGDGSDAIHLFERDCSLQRRHQKVIEEAPAPGMTQDVRAAMGQAAFRRPKRLGIRGRDG